MKAGSKSVDVVKCWDVLSHDFHVIRQYTLGSTETATAPKWTACDNHLGQLDYHLPIAAKQQSYFAEPRFRSSRHARYA
jgi:hypothetical protein